MGGYGWVEREVKDSSRGPICGQVEVPARLRRRGSINSTYERPAQKVGGREGRTQDGSRAVRRGRRVDWRDASEKPISKSDSILGTEGRRDGATGAGRRDGPPKSRRASSRPPLCIAPIQPVRCPLLWARKCAYAPFTLDVLQNIKCFRRFPSPVMGEIIFIPS